jgi:hypothetical protein
VPLACGKLQHQRARSPRDIGRSAGDYPKLNFYTETESNN